MTTNLSAVGSLILTRMLTVGEKGESAANVKKDLEPLLAHRWAGAELTERINQTLIDLAALGMVMRLPVKSKKAVPKFVSTAEGHRHALEFLGVDSAQAENHLVCSQDDLSPRACPGDARVERGIIQDTEVRA